MIQYYIQFEYGQFKMMGTHDGGSPYIVAWGNTLDAVLHDAANYLGRKISIPVLVGEQE